MHKQIANTKGKPSKQETLHFGNSRINTHTIISFNPSRVPGGPFNKDGEYDNKYPTPALHQSSKKAG